jgi:uncharacterized OB-fold protein
MGAHISIPMYQRAIPQRYRLVGHRCLKCGSVNFPPKATCKYCFSGSEFEEVTLSGRGIIYSYTIIAGGGAPPEFSEQAHCQGSYPVVLVELEEGPRVIAQLVDPPAEGISIGMPVQAVFRKIYEEEGVIRYGFKFRPV